MYGLTHSLYHLWGTVTDLQRFSLSALCPPLPVWVGYSVESYGYSRMQGSNLIYGCLGYYHNYNDYEKWLEGKVYYSFADGTSGNKTATCGADGQWDPPIEPCVGKWILTFQGDFHFTNALWQTCALWRWNFWKSTLTYQKWVALIDPMTNDWSYCVSLTSKHPMIKSTH